MRGNGILAKEKVPAPVVPPARFEDSNVGDCCISRLRSPIVMSREEAFGSTKPRFWEGIACEKSRKDSNGDVMSHINNGVGLSSTDLHTHLPPRRPASGADLRLPFALAMLSSGLGLLAGAKDGMVHDGRSVPENLRPAKFLKPESCTCGAI